MIELAHPLVLALLPLPVVFRWLAGAHFSHQDALQAPFFSQLVLLTGQQANRGGAVAGRNRLQWLLLVSMWLLIVCAAARPQWIGEPITQTTAARDLMIAVDLSGSMATEDFAAGDGAALSRLAGLKQVLHRFIEGRDSDRLGLIVFGSAPYIQVPLTLDLGLFNTLLDETRVGMAGPKTMLGDAIGLSIKHFDSSEANNKVLLLVTDGNDTASQVPPRQAANTAQQQGISIHVIAIGDPETVGEEALDIELMQTISEQTGGRYFHANDVSALDDIYQTLDQLETAEVDSVSYRPKTDLFHWPLALAVLAALILHGYYAFGHWRSQRSARSVSL